jgi:HD-GYP domain-containing protein (c-di-GMP phosphodiesterase class II)
MDYEDDLNTAALLHDYGKIGVPDAILSKPGPLSRAERLIINKHPEYGGEVLRGIPGFERVSLFVLHHHERVDGKGYPNGLAGYDVPLGSRTVSLLDAFDAMTSTRCYRKALPWEEAMRRLEAGGGIQFDSEVLAYFVRMIGCTSPERFEISEAVPTPQLALAGAEALT